MLKLTNINKYYKVGEENVKVLNDVNLSFGKREFVSILGSSGSGKTTLLNIIGGLDRYSSGDLIVEGKSTKDFKDKDWDSYRNSTIGFVFQSYNLISHLSVLDNVAIALSLSGVSASERNKIAKEALTEVGLEKHINKRPNQLSGGQMQRVAIARALVNNPKILLADEPTGALDTNISIQIMELIKKISKDRLVIMVTHNPELAKEYSDRIIRVSDGDVVEDTKPFKSETITNEPEKLKTKGTSMSFLTALKSSFKNLTTKKARTSITAFAGSIGIISIALVLAISSGMNAYVKKMQEDTLSGFPLTISQTSTASFDGMQRPNSKDDENSNNKVIQAKGETKAHSNNYATDVLGEGYTFIDYLNNNSSKYNATISYASGYKLKALIQNKDESYKEVLDNNKNSVSFFGGSSSIFNELPTNADLVLGQYNVVAKISDSFTYPKDASEAVLVVGSDNKLSKSTLEALGYNADDKINYDDILGKTLSVISNDNYYLENSNIGYFTQKIVDKNMYDSGYKVKIVGILKPKDAKSSTLLSSGIGYTKELTDYMCNIDKDSEIVKNQKENKNSNVLSPNKAPIDDATYTGLLKILGGDSTPTQISIYPTSFDDKEKILNVIHDYNDKVSQKFGLDTDSSKDNAIVYSDMGEAIASTITTMIKTITVILTAFAAISLVVSSIMIGIITYVSVVERTKEIGIMRAIGARKKDISRIFNAEAIIIGLISGTLGVIIASLITIPVNSVIESQMQIEGFKANLPIMQAVFLVILSVILTFIAGLIPSKIASKKQPVEALRSE